MHKVEKKENVPLFLRRRHDFARVVFGAPLQVHTRELQGL